MEGKRIQIEELVKKGFVKEYAMGVSDVYSKQHSWGEKVLLYNPFTEKVLISTRNTTEEMRNKYKR